MRDLKAGIKFLLQKFYEAGSRKIAQQFICDQILCLFGRQAHEASIQNLTAFYFGEIRAGLKKLNTQYTKLVYSTTGFNVVVYLCRDNIRKKTRIYLKSFVPLA